MVVRVTPRTRKIVIAAGIVLGVCAYLLTPSHQADRPRPHTSPSPVAAIHPVDPPPLRPLPNYLRRLRPELDAARYPPLPPTDVTQTSDPDHAEAASTPDPIPDWLSGNPLAELGVVIPLPICADCDEPRDTLARMPLGMPLGGILYSGGGGGGGGLGGGSPVAGGDAPNNLIELTPQVGSGGGQGSSGPGGPTDGGGGDVPPRNPGPNPPNPNPPTIAPPGTPGEPNEPGPKDPPVESVPEPTALLFAGFGAAGFVIMEHLASKRRG